MLDRQQLKKAIHQRGLTKTDQLLLCLAVDETTPKPQNAIRELGVHAGIASARTWNVGGILSGSHGWAIKTPAGWELGPRGRERVEHLIGPPAPKPHAAIASSVGSALNKLTNSDTRAFVEQAVNCFQAGYHRAAVVLGWVGAVAVLYDHVVTTHLASFNTEALRRDSKWRPAKTSDDLARMKEHDFLQVLEAISVIGKSVKAELEVCLKLRNGCGHPNNLQIGENRVAAHLETLVLNVFAKFA